ncbi:Ankyrin repeat-containing domain, partial [Trinorchestia longiramus]
FTSKLYNCCITHNVDDLRGILDSVDEQLITNQYVGAETILHYILKFADDELLSEILDLGCDPWHKNVAGDLPLSDALQIGYAPNVDLLIQNMKETKQQGYVDLTEQSFRYLNILLTSSEAEGNFGDIVDHTKCLQRLLEDDVLLDVNAVDSCGSGVNALQVATVVSNQEAIRMLLAKGAFIGTKRTVNGRVGEGIFTAVLPETLSSAINDCVNVQRSELYS